MTDRVIRSNPAFGIRYGRPRWEVEYGAPGEPVSILPAGMDRSNLRDVTRVGDAYRRYLNERTGEEIDCMQYAKMYEDENTL
jgi:hypothetical protein